MENSCIQFSPVSCKNQFLVIATPKQHGRHGHAADCLLNFCSDFIQINGSNQPSQMTQTTK